MTDIDENLVPEPAADVDPRALDIQPTAEEFFILSRLTGSISIGQICKTSGLGHDKTLQCVKNLLKHGLIHVPGVSVEDSAGDEESTPSTPEVTSEHETSSRATADSGRSSSAVTASDDLGKALQSRFPIPFMEFEFDDELLGQQVEIDDDFKREILFVCGQLDDVDYYQLLGVDQEAKRRDLRRAYFPLSKRFHPDRFYQKILGDYEQMVQRIFQRVTLAYQTLSDRNKRSEYDASLRRGRTSHATPQMASTPASRRSEPQEVIQGDRKRAMAFKVLVQRGDKAMKAGSIPAALREYRKALTLQRDLQLPLRVARELLEHEGYLEDATSFARTAHNIESSSVEALKLIGEIYERKEEHDDALYHYELALEATPDDPDLQERVDRLQR